MDNYKYLNTKIKNKDNSKGHKIAAALYLVTNHLSDNDPLKVSIRTHAVNLVGLAGDHQTETIAEHISMLLEMASLAQVISEKNASIISLELRHYIALLTSEANDMTVLFTPVLETDTFKKPANTNMSYNLRQPSVVSNVKNPVLNENKSKRQDTILSFINDRKSAGIKDIAALFSDTSEKTIQRELGALVGAGKITKRGEKRWSVYMSV